MCKLEDKMRDDECQLPSSSQMQDLPFELLVLVLRSVPQQERLGVCALVCHSWFSAALSATVSIDISCAAQARCTALSHWLQGSGRACAIDSVHISSGAADYEHQPTLVLAVDTLCGLQRLVLDQSNIAVVHSSVTAAKHHGRLSAAAAAAAATAGATQGGVVGGCAASRTHCNTVLLSATTPQSPSPLAAAVAAAAAGAMVASCPPLLSAAQQCPQHSTCHNSCCCTLSSHSCPAAAGLLAVASLASLTSLTELRLTDCYMAAEGLQQLTALQSLELTLLVLPGDWVDLDDAASQLTECEAVVHDGISALRQQLTRLTLSGMYCTDTIMAQVSSLSRLQALSLFAPEVTAESFKPQALPISITRLDLAAGADPFRFHYEVHPVDLVISPESTPALTELTNLQQLRLGSVYLNPDVLASLVQLTALEAQSCSLVSADVTGAQPTAAAPATLTVLSGLTQLQRLTFACKHSKGQGSWTAADCAALTASSHLTYLNIAALEVLCQHAHTSSSCSCCSRNSGVASSNARCSSASACCSRVDTSSTTPGSSCSSSTGLFGPHTQLPHLRELHVPCWVLHDAAAVSRLAACCANVDTLSISTGTMSCPSANSRAGEVRTCTWQGLQGDLRALMLQDVQPEVTGGSSECRGGTQAAAAPAATSACRGGSKGALKVVVTL